VDSKAPLILPSNNKYKEKKKNLWKCNYKSVTGWHFCIRIFLVHTRIRKQFQPIFITHVTILLELENTSFPTKHFHSFTKYSSQVWEIQADGGYL
jgi:hypothetical protein